MGIIKKDNDKKTAASTEFIKHVISEESQQKLSLIGLFSVCSGLENMYSNNVNLFKLNQSLNKNLIVCPLFTDKNLIKEINNASIGYLLGDENAKNKLIEFKQSCIR